MPGVNDVLIHAVKNLLILNIYLRQQKPKKEVIIFNIQHGMDGGFKILGLEELPGSGHLQRG